MDLFSNKNYFFYRTVLNYIFELLMFDIIILIILINITKIDLFEI